MYNLVWFNPLLYGNAATDTASIVWCKNDIQQMSVFVYVSTLQPDNYTNKSHLCFTYIVFLRNALLFYGCM